MNARQGAKQLGLWFDAGAHSLETQGSGQQKTPEEAQGVRIQETSEEPGMAMSTGHSQMNTQELAPGPSCCLSPGEPQAGRERGLWA